MMDEMDSARKHGKAKWSLRGEKGEKRRNVGASVAKQGRERADAACG